MSEAPEKRSFDLSITSLTLQSVTGSVVPQVWRTFLTFIFTFLPVCGFPDVIQRAGALAGRRPASEGGSRMAARRCSDAQVLHGATSADVQLSQLTTGSLLFELGTAEHSDTIQITEQEVRGADL